jgi:hypothetical protein
MLQTLKIIYWFVTLICCGIMAYSAFMYFTNTLTVKDYFINKMYYPGYLVLPLAIGKILGIVAIITGFSRTLKEWAYAGFIFDTLLAIAAHLYAKDNGELLAIFTLLATLASRVLWQIILHKKKQIKNNGVA